VSTIVVVFVTDVTVAVEDAMPDPAFHPDADAVTVSPTVKPSVELTVNAAVAAPTATTTLVATIPAGAEDTEPCISAVPLLI
jgi:hypothetical protein